MRNRGFGIGLKSNHPLEIQRTQCEENAEDGFQAEILLREAYEMEYNIYDHTIRTPEEIRLIPVVGKHEKEDRHSNQYFDIFVNRYLAFNLRETFGFSLSDYFNLPLDRANDLTELARKHVEQKQRKIDEFVNDKKKLHNPLT